MRQFISSFFVLLSVLFFSLSCNGQQRIELLNGETIAVSELDNFVQEEMERLGMPGMSFAVLNDGDVVYHRTLGVKNAQEGGDVDKNTTFESASISKAVFAYYVMRMVDQGVIDLDTPLYTYLPNYDLDHDPRYKKITARLILTHQTGLPNWRYVNRGQYLDLKFDPGTQFSYSGEGFEYLGNVIAHLNGVTKKELEELIREDVFDPLDMNVAYFRWNDFLEENKANGHNGGMANGRYQPLIPSMAGGLQTEALSLTRFMSGMINGTGLSEEIYAEMLTPQVDLPEDHIFVTNFDTESWGLGIAIDRTDHGIVYSHGGNNGDFQSYMEFEKETGYGYVFLTNCDRGEQFNTRLKPFMRTGSPYNSPLEESYEVVNRRIQAYEDGEYKGLELLPFPGDGFAWLRDREFSEGTIEFDVKGDDNQGASFVGIAFHAENKDSYEGIYFRPFNFNAETESGRSHMVQYHNIPTHNWRALRMEHPGEYEGEILSPPEPDAWFNVRIEVVNGVITVYVNKKPAPLLRVESLSDRTTGKIGLWVGNNSRGRFANLEIKDR